MKVLLIVAILAAVAMANPMGEFAKFAQTELKAVAEARERLDFEEFKRTFGKTYASPEEHEKRFQIYRLNKFNIELRNKQKRTWTEAVNKFSDLTTEEFQQKHLGYVNTLKTPEPLTRTKSQLNKQMPQRVDWRESGAITAVKDQGSCGSCWAFTAVEMIESYAFLNGGSLMELSPQHMTSCVQNPDNCGGQGGCTGAIPQLAYTYAQLFGVNSEADYPYASGDFGLTGSCEYDNTKVMASTRGYELLPRNSYADVMNHLANVGPLSIAVDASRWGTYQRGVFEGCDYNSNIAINHAVQLVGYGTDETDPNNPIDYWLVRNSWDSNWGEEGYIRLKREPEEQVTCGTDDTPLVGTACEADGVTSQTVCGQCGILFDVTYPIGGYEVV